MHIRETVELAAMLATHADTIIQGSMRPPQGAVEQYWAASKCRQERWQRSMRNYCQQVDKGVRAEHCWRSLRPIIEEILLGELLTRVWLAVADAFDRHTGDNEYEPIARSVFVGHLESRRRALNLMVYGAGFDVGEAVSLNRVRRRAERWNDLLLSPLVAGRLNEQSSHQSSQGCQLVFELDRVAQFASDLRQERQPEGSWSLMLASLRAAFQKGLAPVSPSADLNEQIAASLLSCLGPELFDGVGVIKSLFLVQLNATANDTQGMIEELIAIDDAPLLPPSRWNVHNG